MPQSPPMLEAPRDHCYTCDKVACLCICGDITKVQNRTRITIVQHPREARHPLGTARIARLGLDNFSLLVTTKGEQLRLPAGDAVLFPEPDAPLLSSLSAADRPKHLVVIDGTWSQASALRRQHSALAALPAVRLAPANPSNYRIRREPNPQAISTIEAIVRALEILEPETPNIERLLSSFDKMIDEHIERRRGEPATPRHRRTPRLHKPLPDVFCDASVPTVLVYTELHQPRGQSARFPLRVTAARMESRELVDLLVRTDFPGSKGRIRNMGLGPVTFSNAVEPDALAEQLRTVIKPSDTLVGWPQNPGPALRALGIEQPFFSAKRHFARYKNARVGSLEDLALKRIGGDVLEPWAPGRAGRQLAYLDRVVRAMRAQASEPRED